MRISELSRSSAVSSASIKFYLREKLLKPGERTGANQARYGTEHLARLRLIRALTEVGGLSVSAARDVLEAIDSDAALNEVFATAQRVVSPVIALDAVPGASLALVDAAMPDWQVSPGNPGRLAAARVLGIFAEVGQPVQQHWVDRYAHAALVIAEADLDEVATRTERAEKAQTVVVGTVLGDALISGLRRAAQEHVTTKRFASPAGSPAASPPPGAAIARPEGTPLP